MVLKRGVEGSVTRVADAKVAVFSQGVDTSSTETKVGGWEKVQLGLFTSCKATKLGQRMLFLLLHGRWSKASTES